MERNNAFTMALAGLFALAVWAVPCAARLVTVAITGEVTEGPWTQLDFFEGSVQVGDTITGTYTYDTAAERVGSIYEFSSPPCGFVLEVGGYTFQTDPNDVRFEVNLRNEMFTAGNDTVDRFWMTSYHNLAPGEDFNLSWIELHLENSWEAGHGEPYHPLLGLLSPTLPATAPELHHWPTRELRIGAHEFLVMGRIDAAVLVQEPPKLIYVDAAAPLGSNGSSWDRAYRTVQDALADANVAEKPVGIRVAQGRYQPDQGVGQILGDREAAFQLLNEVTLIGGYAGLEGDDPNVRDPRRYETVLTGDLLGNDLPGFRQRNDNSYHVVTALGTDESAVIDGFIIEGGHADGLSTDGSAGDEDHALNGGGLYLDGGSLTIRHCTFRGNYARQCGGGVYVAGLPPRIHNSVFSGNVADAGGGGLSLATHVLLEGCVFQGNSARSGGAILRHDQLLDLYLINCTVADNRAHAGHPIDNADPNERLSSGIRLCNSIVWDPRYFPNYRQSRLHYSDVYGEIAWGAYDVIAVSVDPCFAAPGHWADPDDLGAATDPNDPRAAWVAGDYHLKSQARHWDTASQNWVLDEVTSPCIDAGDPASLVDDEPTPNGARINMGAYGGTAEASKSYSQDQ